MNGIYNRHLVHFPSLFWVIDFATWYVLPLSIVLLIKRRRTFNLSDFGFKRIIFGKKNILFLALVCIIVTPITYFIYILCYKLSLSIIETVHVFSYESMMPSNKFMRFIIIFYYSLSAGFVEELYYRGIFRKIFDQFTKKTLLYILLSSLIFSLVHWEGGIQNVIATFGLGLFLSILYVKINNIWPLVTGHLVTDIICFW